jgi:hypothetical protein
MYIDNQPNAMEQVILGAILMHPEGATQDDVERIVRVKFPSASVTPRFSALKRKGLVVETGEKRAGVSGRPQAVLKAAAFTARLI